jgi:hypothetical protein
LTIYVAGVGGNGTGSSSGGVGGTGYGIGGVGGGTGGGGGGGSSAIVLNATDVYIVVGGAGGGGPSYGSYDNWGGNNSGKDGGGGVFAGRGGNAGTGGVAGGGTGYNGGGGAGYAGGGAGGGAGYGGGGGSAVGAGGGGGGSYTNLSILTITSGNSSNTRQANGYVIITYSVVLPPVCFLSDCDILLSSNTYKNITEITVDDSVLGYFSKQPQKIKEIIKRVHTLPTLQATNLPCLIRKNKFGENIPNKDIHLSGHHRIIFVHIGIQAYKLVDYAEDISSPVTYHHIVLQNTSECLICNNLPVESCVD